MKSKKGRNRKFVVLTILCLFVNLIVFSAIFKTFASVYEKKNEKNELSVKLDTLKEENERLKVEVDKLQDPEYVARYVRERYLYSAKGEYILRID